MNRREFAQRSGSAVLFLMAGGSALLTGCGVLTDIENWIPVGLQAFQAIISLLEGAGIISIAAGGPIAGLVATITSGFNDLTTAIKQYQAITPPPTGAMANIEAVLNSIVGNFQTFLASINITNSKLTTLVVGMAEIILGTIAGFENLLPTSTATLLAKGTRVGQAVVPLIPKHRTRRAFKHEWNGLVTASGHPELKLHVSLFERL